MRGHIKFNKFGRRKDTRQDVGQLRAVIRVCVSNPRGDVPYNKFFNSLKSVTKVQVRLYVIRAQNLQPKDFNGFADPFCKVTLGSTVISDRASKQEATLNPEIFRRFDFQTVLPGPSSLLLQIFDANSYTSDKLIGETTIDLEDRWFHPKWTSIKTKEKPLESRNLFTKGNDTTQGLVMLWIDIMNMAESQKYPKIDICGPEKKKIEVRIICWRSRNTPNMDGNLSDTYCKFWMDGGDGVIHRTDTHFRCKTQKAIWNWRIKFYVELPIKNREMGRLRVQCWDWDLFGDGDLIGESSVDLYDWFLKAYHTPNGISIFPFKDEQAARDRMLHESGAFDFNAGGDTGTGTTEEKEPEEEEEEEEEPAEETEEDDAKGDDDEAMNPLLGAKKPQPGKAVIDDEDEVILVPSRSHMTANLFIILSLSSKHIY